ncbi:hypothetical protein [Lysobacter sp. HA35]
MAKQVLVEARQVMLPEWRRDYWLRDIGGEAHGFIDHRTARIWAYKSAKDEVWHEGIRPDVFLSDDGAAATLPLLVEVKVSHAVDDTKARLVRDQGWAMVEIDLAKTPDELLESDRFANFVLMGAPRKWVHAPKAEQRYAENKAAVRTMVEAINAELRAQGVEERDEFGRTAKERKREHDIESLRKSRRKPFLADLKALERAVLPDIVRQQEADRCVMETDDIARLVRRHRGKIPQFARTAHRDAWCIEASSVRWQLELAERFVFSAPEGTRLLSGVLSRWVEKTYGINEVAARLIQAQRDDRERRKKRGDSGPQAMLRHAWYFDSWENENVPSTFKAVERLMAELVKAGHLLKAERYAYVVDGPKGREERRMGEERRREELAKEKRKALEGLAERQRMAQLRMDTHDRERERRTQALVDAYTAMEGRYAECLDCQDCRWPSPPEAEACENCRSANTLLVRLDPARLREIPFRLRCDPCVMKTASYPFEREPAWTAPDTIAGGDGQAPAEGEGT